MMSYRNPRLVYLLYFADVTECQQRTNTYVSAELDCTVHTYQHRTPEFQR